MNSETECPICMDCIGPINCITTECGHIFHANCLIKNMERNGFSCPCCRSQMVEEREESDDDSDDSDYETDDDSDHDSDGYESIIDDDEYALRGLRFFTNLLEGEEHDQLDIIDEYQDEREQEQEQQEQQERQIPSVDFVAEKLREQGVTFEQLIAWTLIDHTKGVIEQIINDEKMVELETYSGNIYEKFKTIIDNFNT